MKTALLLLLPLLLINCTTVKDQESAPMTDSEQIFETLSTSPEFLGMSILLCIDKDCLTVDRHGEKPSSRRRVIDDETDREN